MGKKKRKSRRCLYEVLDNALDAMFFRMGIFFNKLFLKELKICKKLDNHIEEHSE